jgi:hypothetical protein
MPTPSWERQDAWDRPSARHGSLTVPGPGESQWRFQDEPGPLIVADDVRQ